MGDRLRKFAGDRRTTVKTARKVESRLPEPGTPPTGSHNLSFVRNQAIQCAQFGSVNEQACLRSSRRQSIIIGVYRDGDCLTRRADGAAGVGRASYRFSCSELTVDSSTLGNPSGLAIRNARVVPVMAELARKYPRYGYRRIQVFFARRGFAMRADRACRLCRQAQVQVPRRPPATPDCVWSTAPDTAYRRQPRLGLRLRPRPLRHVSAPRVPDGRRRVDT